MKCALADVGFINENIQHNKQVIIDTLIKCSKEADIVVFGEAFLQGFYAATFDIEHDKKIAIGQNDPIIKEICNTAKTHNIAVSFGFIEKSGDCFYSSQITIGANGEIIDMYRRVSPGWKLPDAGEKHLEGDGFHIFSYLGRTIAVGLCGDLRFDENISEINELHPDVVFWPVYTDFNYNEWNKSTKYEYAEQAGKLGGKILYVNSVCLDKDEEEIARGGAVLFIDGAIDKEVPSGKEEILFIEV